MHGVLQSARLGLQGGPSGVEPLLGRSHVSLAGPGQGALAQASGGTHQEGLSLLRGLGALGAGRGGLGQEGIQIDAVHPRQQFQTRLRIRWQGQVQDAQDGPLEGLPGLQGEEGLRGGRGGDDGVVACRIVAQLAQIHRGQTEGIRQVVGLAAGAIRHHHLEAPLRQTFGQILGHGSHAHQGHRSPPGQAFHQVLERHGGHTDVTVRQTQPGTQALAFTDHVLDGGLSLIPGTAHLAGLHQGVLELAGNLPVAEVGGLQSRRHGQQVAPGFLTFVTPDARPRIDGLRLAAPDHPQHPLAGGQIDQLPGPTALLPVPQVAWNAVTHHMLSHHVEIVDGCVEAEEHGFHRKFHDRPDGFRVGHRFVMLLRKWLPSHLSILSIPWPCTALTKNRTDHHQDTKTPRHQGTKALRHQRKQVLVSWWLVF